MILDAPATRTYARLDEAAAGRVFLALADGDGRVAAVRVRDGVGRGRVVVTVGDGVLLGVLLGCFSGCFWEWTAWCGRGARFWWRTRSARWSRPPAPE
ncbi:hypothetical protein HCN51_48780 [Nonomuraea sp. FMUSA5-5]|uniref:Uncharacterized protein n=1 Tax=Nonomuraea composti TaxID=2720023 RepID=A0ABX1BHM1_9ACTN|nr:hypothetical protein [Nonomuraea sp. FMUSA5-5]NJP97238.1 hypothetical protein [Nonomuraea sp. FMUSA5-5]